MERGPLEGDNEPEWRYKQQSFDDDEEDRYGHLELFEDEMENELLKSFWSSVPKGTTILRR